MDEQNKLFHAPYFRHRDTTQRIMLYFIIAMIPTAAFGVYNFGLKTLIVIMTAILACELAEIGFHFIKKEKQTWKDLSAVVTGLMFSMILPSNLSWWKVALAGIIGMLVFRLLFGGFGHGYINPAIGAKCLLMLVFFKDMNTFVYNGTKTATPLEALKSGETVNTMNMLLGKVSGNIGEVSVICVLIGAIFLILVGVLDLSVAGPGVLALGVMITLFGGNGFDWSYIVAQLCGGGFMFCIFFLATDGATSPITVHGKWIYGALIGILTGVFRMVGLLNESVLFAIVLANIAAPFIENFTIPKYFGNPKANKLFLRK